MDFKTANQFIKLSINEKRKYADLLANYIGYKEFTNSDIFKILSSNKKFDKYLFELKVNRSDDLDFLNEIANTNNSLSLLNNTNLDLKLTEKLVIKHAKSLTSGIIFELKEFTNLNVNVITSVLNLNNRILYAVILMLNFSDKLSHIIDFISNEEYTLDLGYNEFKSIIQVIIHNFEQLSNNLCFNYSCWNYIANSYNKKDINLITICDLFFIHSYSKLDLKKVSYSYYYKTEQILDFARETRNSIFK